jgi:hypothetical protein
MHLPVVFQTYLRYKDDTRNVTVLNDRFILIGSGRQRIVRCHQPQRMRRSRRPYWSRCPVVAAAAAAATPLYLNRKWIPAESGSWSQAAKSLPGTGTVSCKQSPAKRTHSNSGTSNNAMSFSLTGPKYIFQGCGSGLTSIRIRMRMQRFRSIRMRIRIHNVIESGSNADPDPQENL